MTDHDLTVNPDTKEYYCQICKWSWETRPHGKNGCPGLMRIDVDAGRWAKHEYLRTKTDLLKDKLIPPSEPIACYWNSKGNNFVVLYDARQAAPKVKKG